MERNSTLEAEPPAQFRIGELARRVGATPRAVRYYEQFGLLPDRARDDGAHRVYDARDEQRLRDLLRIRDLLGLSLNELREWMQAEDARARLRERWHGQPQPDDETRAAIIREAIEHMDAQLAVVRARRSALEQLEDELASTRRRVRSLLSEIEQGLA
ncbi:MAG: MerR family transcriptional regulator, repressor of the yfmOP operon [Mycobacterium sp.]|nr:MerR family transcriptional regulator, repressor of the yfmOP operon [Mycobacterium sp.]